MGNDKIKQIKSNLERKRVVKLGLRPGHLQGRQEAGQLLVDCTEQHNEEQIDKGSRHDHHIIRVLAPENGNIGRRIEGNLNGHPVDDDGHHDENCDDNAQKNKGRGDEKVGQPVVEEAYGGLLQLRNRVLVTALEATWRKR